MGGKLLNVLGLVALVIVVGGIYVGYRENQANGIGTITSITQLEGLSPTICTFAEGQLGTGSGGTMYVDMGRISVEVDQLEITGYAGEMRAVLNLSGSLQFAPQSVPAGTSYANAEDALNTVITQAPWRCSPWWFPDDSLFNIPNAVTP